jgi:hypothetical protein
MKNNTTLRYRNVAYSYHEWTTWNGKEATGFTIKDEELFKHTNPRVISTGAKTIEEAQSIIDDYLDNVDKYKELAELHSKGCQAYYDSKTRWDNFTGD